MTLFLGSGPYCYANSLAMVLDGSVPASAIEVLTGSPFGAQFEAGGLPCFDPAGWDPDQGLDAAIALLGRTCERTTGGSADEALARLRGACADGPVIVGPVDIGLLTHQPWSAGAATGVDHWVLVLAADDETVRMHDPDGFPFATLPTAQFLAAWRADRLTWGGSYTMRARFARTSDVVLEDALRASIPAAVRWLGGGGEEALGGGGEEAQAGGGKEAVGRGGEEALGRLADRLEEGIDDRLREHLVFFAVRCGARRLADAARWLAGISPEAARIAGEQAALLGSSQFPLVRRDDKTAADILRTMRYEEWRIALAREIGG